MPEASVARWLVGSLKRVDFLSATAKRPATGLVRAKTEVVAYWWTHTIPNLKGRYVMNWFGKQGSLLRMERRRRDSPKKN